jgi:hypothetical protein
LNAKGEWEQEFVAAEHAEPKAQVKPRRDIENRGVRDKIYCEDAIENGGHLSLLPNHSALFNSQPSTNRSQLFFTVARPFLYWNTTEGVATILRQDSLD